MLLLSLNGRSDDVLPLPRRLKAKWRGVNGEIGAPCLTIGEEAIGGKPGVRGIIPGADNGTMLGDFRISSSNSFSTRFSSLSSRIFSFSSLVMKQEWTLIPKSTAYRAITITVMAKRDLACWQYPMFDWCAATLQLFVIYHGGPGCGCWGSDVSLPAWYRAATI